jgi:hypothetical protein
MNPAAMESAQAFPRDPSHQTGEGSKMTTIATKTEPRMASHGLPSAGNSAAGRIARPEARPQADLSIAASLPWASSRWRVIWISHFNY